MAHCRQAVDSKHWRSCFRDPVSLIASMEGPGKGSVWTKAASIHMAGGWTQFLYNWKSIGQNWTTETELNILLQLNSRPKTWHLDWCLCLCRKGLCLSWTTAELTWRRSTSKRAQCLTPQFVAVEFSTVFQCFPRETIDKVNRCETKRPTVSCWQPKSPNTVAHGVLGCVGWFKVQEEYVREIGEEAPWFHAESQLFRDILPVRRCNGCTFFWRSSMWWPAQP